MDMTERSQPTAPPRAPGSEEAPLARPRRGRVARRPRRDLVTWVALGLLVAVVLAIVSKTTTTTHDPPHADTRPTLPSRSDHIARRPDPPATRHPLRTVSPPTRRPDSQPTATDPPTPATTVPATQTTTSTVARPPGTTEPSSTPSQLQYSGVLNYPRDVATSIPFSAPDGVAAARITWSGGVELIGTLRCRGADDSAPGQHGISISIDGSPGTCTVAISLAPGVRAQVAYAVTVFTPGDAG